MITSATSSQAQQAADSFKVRPWIDTRTLTPPTVHVVLTVVFFIVVQKYFRATLNVRFEAEKDEALREHGTFTS
jgi:hypothetical protein